MKSIFFLVLCIGFLSFGQTTKETKSFTSSYNINDRSDIFLKSSGEKISFAEFSKLVKKEPNLAIGVKEEDLDGNPISYFVLDSESNKFSFLNTIERRNTENGIVKFSEIKSSKILVILQLELAFPMINVNDIKAAENIFLSRDYPSILFTTTSQKEAKAFAIQNEIKSVIIPNAFELIRKFNIRRTPAFLIFDQDKNLLDKTSYGEDVEGILDEHE